MIDSDVATPEEVDDTVYYTNRDRLGNIVSGRGYTLSLSGRGYALSLSHLLQPYTTATPEQSQEERRGSHFARTYPLCRSGGPAVGGCAWLERDPRPGVRGVLMGNVEARFLGSKIGHWKEMVREFTGGDGDGDGEKKSGGTRLYVCLSVRWPFDVVRREGDQWPEGWLEQLAMHLREEEESWGREFYGFGEGVEEGGSMSRDYRGPVENAVGLSVFPSEVFEHCPRARHDREFDLSATHPELLLFDV